MFKDHYLNLRLIGHSGKKLSSFKSILQQDPVGHYQLGQKNIVYLEMIYLGVQCMYFRAKPLQNQCILELVHYTK